MDNNFKSSNWFNQILASDQATLEFWIEYQLLTVMAQYRILFLFEISGIVHITMELQNFEVFDKPNKEYMARS